MSGPRDPGHLSVSDREERYWVLYESGRREQASHEARAGLVDHPGDMKLLGLLAGSELSLARYDEARAAAEQALAVGPGSQRALGVLSRLALRDEDWDEAERIGREMVAQAPSSWWAHLQQASIAAMLPDCSEREEVIEHHLARSLELDPEESDTYVVATQIWARLGRIDRAREMALAGLAVYPTHVDLQSYATALTEDDDVAALRTHSASLAGDPTSAEARSLMIDGIWGLVAQAMRAAMALNFLYLSFVVLSVEYVVKPEVWWGMAAGPVAGLVTLVLKVGKAVPRRMLRHFASAHPAVTALLVLLGAAMLGIGASAAVAAPSRASTPVDFGVHASIAVVVALLLVAADALYLRARARAGGRLGDGGGDEVGDARFFSGYFRSLVFRLSFAALLLVFAMVLDGPSGVRPVLVTLALAACAGPLLPFLSVWPKDVSARVVVVLVLCLTVGVLIGASVVLLS